MLLISRRYLRYQRLLLISRRNLRYQRRLMLHRLCLRLPLPCLTNYLRQILVQFLRPNQQ
jgi:hypothetical protein